MALLLRVEAGRKLRTTPRNRAGTLTRRHGQRGLQNAAGGGAEGVL